MSISCHLIPVIIALALRASRGKGAALPLTPAAVEEDHRVALFGQHQVDLAFVQASTVGQVTDELGLLHSLTGLDLGAIGAIRLNFLCHVRTLLN